MGVSLFWICPRASSADWIMMGVIWGLLLPLVRRGVEGGGVSECGEGGSLSGGTSSISGEAVEISDWPSGSSRDSKQLSTERLPME